MKQQSCWDEESVARAQCGTVTVPSYKYGSTWVVVNSPTDRHYSKKFRPAGFILTTIQLHRGFHIRKCF